MYAWSFLKANTKRLQTSKNKGILPFARSTERCQEQTSFLRKITLGLGVENGKMRLQNARCESRMLYRIHLLYQAFLSQEEDVNDKNRKCERQVPPSLS